MTSIAIQLVQGPNYISFPASSLNTFRTIFTDSGTIDDIDIDSSGNKMFYRFDPILNNYVLINVDMGHIEEGKGYYLYIKSISPHNIAYEGIEYTVTFDQFKSRIIKGWNLLGVGKDAIIPQYWCTILDPITNNIVTILEPTKSYMVNYDECVQPDTPSIGSASMGAIIAIGTILGTYYLLRRFSIIGKPLSE
jgi:hypothetical protein